eukprot:g3827.t1
MFRTHAAVLTHIPAVRLSKAKIQYVIFQIQKVDGMEAIEVVEEGVKVKEDAQDQAWDEFTGKLPENEGRYAVFDLRWQQDDGRKRDSVCFVSWTPDGAKIRQKMMYGATQESFKGSLEGIKSTIVAHDMSDLTDGRAAVLKK